MTKERYEQVIGTCMNQRCYEVTRRVAGSATRRMVLKIFCLNLTAVVVSSSLVLGADAPPATARAGKAALHWSEISAKATTEHSGDGLAVVPTPEGARLCCVFQRLEGEATSEGLWLTSTSTNTAKDRFRVVAATMGRLTSHTDIRSEPPYVGCYREIASTGRVAIEGETVRFVRPGLTEEYTVSMDGVRQDFVVLEKPAGAGQLQVQLAVSGARVETMPAGARLVPATSGRKIAYNRLRATDAEGKELTARMEVPAKGESRKQKAETSLAVVIDDTDAVYPVRIDPTFSDANWISMGGLTGVNGEVYAAVADGSGNLYIGGEFTAAGDVIANYIAKWNGNSWSALGAGVNGAVKALAVSGSDLYAGGLFSTAGGIVVSNIAKWNGSSWSALGSGMNIQVYALAVSGSDLYAGGVFTTAGGVAATNIAKWNGSNWSALGLGIGDPVVYDSVWAVAVSGSDLYAGGQFRTAGGVAANCIAKWDGSSWSALGSGLNGRVCALAVSGSDLYAGGDFTTAFGGPGNHIAKWDGSSWSALGSGVGPFNAPVAVRALAVLGSDLYAGGDFTTAGAISANCIAKWDGNAWSPLGSGMNDYVYALAVSGSDLYAGGQFRTADGVAANCIAKWNGSSWSALGSGTVGGGRFHVEALAVSGKELYVGGDFTLVAGNSANCIVKWNGSGWSALGSGMGGGSSDGPSVFALAVSGNELYAAGDFTVAGGSSATNIAKWNGSSWSALGSGMGGGSSDGPFVSALAVSGNDLYAGGDFTESGGIVVSNIAKWNGSSWSALGSGMNGQVYALAVSGSNVYAGGYFTTAGGTPADNIAKWNGSSWSALGSGIGGGAPYDAYVEALAVSGSDLYVGGYFTSAGGITASNIAKWDGSNWSALGSGMGGDGSYNDYVYVYVLAVSGGDLYAGGTFTTAGGIPATNIAKWNGSSWSALGSGVGGANGNEATVFAMAVSGSDLYAGGNFTTAGGKVSAYLARAIVNPPVLAVDPDGFGGFLINFSGVPGSAYRLQRAPTLQGPWISSAPETAPASGVVQFWDLFPPPGQGFYRTVQP